MWTRLKAKRERSEDRWRAVDVLESGEDSFYTFYILRKEMENQKTLRAKWLWVFDEGGGLQLCRHNCTAPPPNTHITSVPQWSFNRSLVDARWVFSLTQPQYILGSSSTLGWFSFLNISSIPWNPASLRYPCGSCLSVDVNNHEREV